LPRELSRRQFIGASCGRRLRGAQARCAGRGRCCFAALRLNPRSLSSPCADRPQRGAASATMPRPAGPRRWHARSRSPVASDAPPRSALPKKPRAWRRVSLIFEVRLFVAIIRDKRRGRVEPTLPAASLHPPRLEHDRRASLHQASSHSAQRSREAAQATREVLFYLLAHPRRLRPVFWLLAQYARKPPSTGKVTPVT
jgi:hypothetical protein